MRGEGITPAQRVFSLTNISKMYVGIAETDNSYTSGVEYSSHSGLETLCRRGLGKRNEEKLIQLKLQGEFRKQNAIIRAGDWPGHVS